MADMTIKEVKKAKIELESSVLKLMKSFETTTGVRLGYVDISRKPPKSNKRNRAIDVPISDNERPGPIMNVDIRAELDLIY